MNHSDCGGRLWEEAILVIGFSHLSKTILNYPTLQIAMVMILGGGPLEMVGSPVGISVLTKGT